MIGRIEGSKINVAMKTCAATQAYYACGGGGRGHHGQVGWVFD